MVKAKPHEGIDFAVDEGFDRVIVCAGDFIEAEEVIELFGGEG